MYCKKCGAANDKDAVFCSRCGTRLVSAATSQPRPKVGTAARTVKKKFPIKILVTTIIIAVLAIATFLMLGRSSNRNYENITRRYIEASYGHDGKKYLALFPSALTDEVYQNSGVSKEDVYAYYSNKLAENFDEVQDGDKWKISFEITECNEYIGYDLERIEMAYQQAGIRLKLDAAQSVKYSLQLTVNGKKQKETPRSVDLMQIDGRWYVNDYYERGYFIDAEMVLRDFSVIGREKQEKEDRDFIAEYLGCSTDNLPPAPDEMIDDRPHIMFYYVDAAGHRSDYRLYVLRKGNDARVMAYYPWNIMVNNQPYNIPVEELPEDERDNTWKIKFKDAAQPQQPVITPPETSQAEPDNGVVSAFPDGDEHKTSVIYVEDLEITEEEELSLIAKQRPALIKYLGCSEDNLWSGYVVCTQGDMQQIGFWYVDDYQEISDKFIILLEDGTAAWFDDSNIYWNQEHIAGKFAVNTIAKNEFKPTQQGQNTIDARKLPESKQKALIAEYLGCNEGELVYYKTNQAQRMEFDCTNDEIYGLVFLLDDGTVAQHYEAEPPLRAEGASGLSGNGQAAVSSEVYNNFIGVFGSRYVRYISDSYSDETDDYRDDTLYISKENGALSIKYMQYRADAYDVTFTSSNWPVIEGNCISFETEYCTVTLEYIAAEDSDYGVDTIYQCYKEGESEWQEFFVRI